MELDWNKRSNKTGSCDIFIFCYKEEYSKRHSLNINSHKHDIIKEYYDMSLTIQEAIDFDVWFTKLKVEFFHKHKVEMDAKWNVQSVKKDYYDNGLTIKESVEEFFSGK